MIDEIHVHNLALIRDATLEPGAGLTVLTGETGAGKTALLSALKLLMGGRASSDLVRDGERELVVSGRFFGVHRPMEPLGASNSDDSDSVDSASFGEGTGSACSGEGAGDDALTVGNADGASNADRSGNADSAGNADDCAVDPNDAGSRDADFDEELVVTRKVTAEGRSRATLNGAMASAGELARLVGPSVDLCGQFENQQLMRPTTHVSLFDSWAGGSVKGKLDAYRAAFSRAKAASSELARIQSAREQSDAMLDEARFILVRIDEVSPLEGEYEQLGKDLLRAEHAETLATAAATAHAALSDDEGALDSLNAAAAALEAGGRHDDALLQLAASLREVGYVLEDVSAQARDYRDSIEFDPAELAAQQERYSALHGLLRTYGPGMEDVFARRAQAAELVEMATDSGERLRRAQEALDAAERELAQAADELDEARAAASPRFDAEVTAVMARLQMSGAAIECRQVRQPRESWAESGPSSFEFLYRAAEGAHPRPLARIASGGEVSRVMLAVKVVLGNHDDVQTLVFDEVDAGVGGAVAVALAEEIARLAQTHQVLVVTHLAQVAVRGQVHYVVRREGAETSLERVEGVDREREVARMLSGSATDTSLAHARELLAGVAGGSGR